eukprot:TRINITY_DN21386_c1_g2_i1.p1 TRINITY_DN21386_c1_g2~~TRINITY_DN21386_c1_g2_i1.p1  ORF type:complete len:398 (-),score=78.85 TRINITY_DN21386_c1_g2_i1:153-1346(-)
MLQLLARGSREAGLVALGARCRLVAGAASAGCVRACSAAAQPARPSRSQHLRKREDDPLSQKKPQEATGKPIRYGPADVDLQPQDQLRPLLPTWNPPPTRTPTPEELDVSTRLRMKFEGRWWAATVRELGEPGGSVKIGYDGWPSRHDEWVERTSDRLYLHESHHADYKPPPLPKKFERPIPKDADGNPLPLTPRTPRPKVFDPEKERLKRALRPPLPYNPEKERLKRQLRGQSAPQEEPLEEESSWIEPSFSAPVVEKAKDVMPATESPLPDRTAPKADVSGNASSHGVTPAAASAASAAQTSGVVSAASSSGAPAQAAAPAPPPPPGPPKRQAVDLVDWVEIPSQLADQRSFRSTRTGQVIQGPPPSGWVEISATGNAKYYWNVATQVTQWERPT